jgi:hypothetical protein
VQSDIVSYYELYQFTKMRIESALRDARGGHKEQSLEFLRFVRNARILQILKPIDFKQIGLDHVDVPHLEWQLAELELECHPSAPNDQTSDIAAIRSTLDLLAAGMQTLLLQKNASKQNL